MKKSRSFIIAGSLILTLSNVVVRFLSYVYRIVMARMLDPHSYGVLNLALPLQYMVILLTSSGIAPTIAKFVSEKKAKKEELGSLIESNLFYYTAGGALIGLLFFAFSPVLGNWLFKDQAATTLLMISSIAIPFAILVSVYTGVFQGFKKVNFMGGVLVFEQTARIGFAVLLVAMGYGVIGAIWGSTFGFIIAVPVAFALFKRLGTGVGRRSLETFKEVFYFSIPTSITALSSFILTYADVLLIGFFLTSLDVGIYSAASPASRLVLAFTTALYAVLLPSVSEVFAKGRVTDIKRYFKLSILAMLFLVVPATIIAFIFSKQIITLLFTETYVQAAFSFQILAVGMLFLSLFMTNSAIFQGMGLAKIPMKILLVSALIDVLLNIILIPSYGIEGAAFSTALASLVAGGASTAMLAKYLNTIE